MSRGVPLAQSFHSTRAKRTSMYTVQCHDMSTIDMVTAHDRFSLMRLKTFFINIVHDQHTHQTE